MASRNTALAFATLLLTPKFLGIAGEILAAHKKKALDAKDDARLRELYKLEDLYDKASGDATEG